MFEGISSTLICFKDNTKRFTEIDLNISNPNSEMKTFNYDPVKFIKGKELIRRVSINRTLPFTAGLNDNQKQKWAIYSKNELILKPVDKKVNFDNILIQSRLTNSFGGLNENKLKKFLDIQDEFD